MRQTDARPAWLRACVSTTRGSMPECRSEDDLVRQRLVIGHELRHELARLDPQCVRPDQVVARRNAASPALELRNKRVVLNTNLLGQFGLRQIALLPKLAQPASRVDAELLHSLV